MIGSNVMRGRSIASVLAAPIVFAALTIAPSARAGDPAAAQALFTEAKQLIAGRRFAEACPKLEESQRLDPGMGTLFHLADCDEHIGKTASAWALFLDVAAQARASGQTARERVARDRAAALEPTLARLTVLATAAESIPGLEVRRDGVVVGKGQRGTPLPVDPGDHEIRASAPGKIAWTTRVRIEPQGKQAVDVPMLADAPANAAAAPQNGATDAVGTTQTTAGFADSGTSSAGGTQRAIGIGIGVIGLAGLGVGTYFGLASKANHDDAASHCTGNTCDSAGVALRGDAIRNGNIATVSLSAGAAVLVTGVIVTLTAPTGRRASTSQSTTPRVGFSPTGVSVQGAF
jgi:hypothetical protein